MGKQPRRRVLVCSFCGKTDAEVDKLVAGPSAYICSECVDLCSEIIAEYEQRELSAATQAIVVLDKTPLLEFLATHAEGRQADAITIGEVVSARRAARARCYNAQIPDEPKRSEVPVAPRPPDQPSTVGTGMVIEDAVDGVGLPPRPPR